MQEEKDAVAYLDSPIGLMKITASLKGVRTLRFVDQKTEPEFENAFTDWAKKELQAYFAKELVVFTVPLDPEGTLFQQKVWEELAKVPFGETRSYKELALTVADEKAVRAVGGANGKNKIPIILPCHRIIGSDGKLVGFSAGIQRKKWLLAHESENQQLELF